MNSQLDYQNHILHTENHNLSKIIQSDNFLR